MLVVVVGEPGELVAGGRAEVLVVVLHRVRVLAAGCWRAGWRARSGVRAPVVECARAGRLYRLVAGLALGGGGPLTLVAGVGARARIDFWRNCWARAGASEPGGRLRAQNNERKLFSMLFEFRLGACAPRVRRECARPRRRTQISAQKQQQQIGRARADPCAATRRAAKWTRAPAGAVWRRRATPTGHANGRRQRAPSA